MNQIERLEQVALAKNITSNVNKKLVKLYDIRKKLDAVVKNKGTKPEARDAATADLAKYAPTIAAAEDRIHQMRRLIKGLQTDALNEGLTEVISVNAKGNRCQVVIHYLRSDGKKMSYTRHLSREGQNWIGLSTLTSSHVTYRLPPSSYLASAA